MNTLMQLPVDAARTVAGSVEHRHDPVKRTTAFDLDRYLGAWRVIAAIPLVPERGACNPSETYSRGRKAGEIKIRCELRRKGFDGPLDIREMTADVTPETGEVEWGVRVGPFHAQYVISFVEPDYSVVIVARNACDDFWLMARDSTLDEPTLQRYKQMIARMGYEPERLVYFPQS